MDTNQIIKQLRDEATHLTQAADILENKDKTTQPEVRPLSVAPSATTSIGHNRTGRRKMSKEARKKISDAQKARWAAQKAA
jgi:hypothetical protein